MSKRSFFLLAVPVFIVCVSLPGFARADLRGSVRKLAAALARTIPAGIRMGVVEFTAGGGWGEPGKKSSIFWLHLGDLLATELARASRGRFSVVERLQLRKLLREAELFGDADPSARPDLSKAGVGGIVTGTYLPSGPGVLISGRLIQVKDGAVLAADSLTVALDRATRGLIDRDFPRLESTGAPAGRLKRPLLDAGVFYEAPNGRGYPVRDGMTLYEDDNYRLYFKANRRAYVYVIQVDSGGAVFRLFPNTEGKFGYRTIGNPVAAGTAVWAPPSPKFLCLDENKGREEIHFFAAGRPIDVFEGAAPLTGKSVRRAINLMGVKGARPGKATVEIKTADGKILSYEQVRARVNARGDLMHQVWFRHR
ncbi:MAG: DUF4384 domain-containing protein [Nitrospinota bacterium]|nr:DUF4384 domain-containing protein [Nitrospinota bacterium]MDP6619429.1 DUF4384 domain-containing protein [Nitrospinota bacterium]